MQLGLPEIFALGAAIGTFAKLINFCAILFAGNRIAIVFNPPEVSGGIHSFLLKIIVSGPGQNFSINFSASLFISLTISFKKFLSPI